jgi:hypothetical protein
MPLSNIFIPLIFLTFLFYGTLKSADSLHTIRTLKQNGSLTFDGTLGTIGSLRSFDTLQANGSLSASGTLDAFG